MFNRYGYGMGLPSFPVPLTSGAPGDATPGGAVDVLTDDDEFSALLDDDGSTFLKDDA
jgi:hypothetical protein